MIASLSTMTKKKLKAKIKSHVEVTDFDDKENLNVDSNHFL